LENYERSTSLDDPDTFLTLVEEAGGYIHTSEERIEQEEITDQFFTETVLDEESRAYRKSLKMNTRNDFKRLYQVYLDSNIKFELIMLSQNIPIRLFKVEKWRLTEELRFPARWCQVHFQKPIALYLRQPKII
jgi:hypothetical protein